MPNAIQTDSENNRTSGWATPGLYDGRPGTVLQQVHDGDTIAVRPKGNIPVRLLGIDTPEISFAFPGPRLNFVGLNDARWNEFLTSCFEAKWGNFTSPVTDELRSYLEVKLSGEPGTEHCRHAKAATDVFRQMVASDMQVLGQDLNTFGYYLRFGFEIMDGFGRFLCVINREQPDRNNPAPRPQTYNMRLLEKGLAFPYFIWPNVNPWDRPATVMDAVIPPGKARQAAEANSELVRARERVQRARQSHLGLFEMTSPLLLEPFELRFLSRRQLPGRYVIDLNSDSNRLIHPHRYYTVPHPEDRLWIPPQYVPLFESRGWVAESAAG